MNKILPMMLIIYSSINLYAVEDTSVVYKRPKLVFSFDGRYSFIRSEAVNISGLKLGLDFRNKFRIGIGVYGLLKPEEYSGSVTRTIKTNKTIIPFHATLKLWYGVIYGEYVIAHKKRWELSIPIQFGIGQTQIDAEPIRKESISAINYLNKNDQNTTVFLIEPSITGYYKIFSWIGVGTGIGYRRMIGADDTMNQNFDNPIYIIKVKLFLGDFIKVVSGKKPVFRFD